MNRTIMRISILLLALGFGLVQLICGQEDRSALKAQEILQEVDVSGGLIVHLGCGDGMLTAGFGADDAYLVHGLDAKVERVAEARGYILPSTLAVSDGRVFYQTAQEEGKLYIATEDGQVLCMGEL